MSASSTSFINSCIFIVCVSLNFNASHNYTITLLIYFYMRIYPDNANEALNEIVVKLAYLRTKSKFITILIIIILSYTHIFNNSS